MTIISKMLPACGFVIAVALVGITSAFKDAPKTNSGDPAYYFEYQSGDPANPANWEYTSDGTGCSGAGESCKILLSEDYVNTGTNPVTIDETMLPNSELPTVTSASNLQVPDPSSSVFTQISNQNP